MDTYGYLAIGSVVFGILLFVYALMKAGSDADDHAEKQLKNIMKEKDSKD